MARATRQRLLDAAVELLISEGRSGITTGRLTNQAGVVQSGFYNHFASVDECMQAALDEVQQEIITTANVIFKALDEPGYTTAGRVNRLLVSVFEQAANDPSSFRLLVQRHHERDVAEAIEAVLDTMRDMTVDTILHAEARTNSLSQVEAEVAASMVVGVFLAGLEEVLGGASPLLTSHACATFVTNGVFAMAGVDTTSPASTTTQLASQISPAAD